MSKAKALSDIENKERQEYLKRRAIFFFEEACSQTIEVVGNAGLKYYLDQVLESYIPYYGDHVRHIQAVRGIFDDTKTDFRNKIAVSFLFQSLYGLVQIYNETKVRQIITDYIQHMDKN